MDLSWAQTPRHQIDGMPHFTLFDHVHTIYESDSEWGTHCSAAVAQWSIMIEYAQNHAHCVWDPHYS